MEGQSSRTSLGDWIGLFHIPCLQEAAFGGRALHSMLPPA
jgi:hypothetical protein